MVNLFHGKSVRSLLRLLLPYNTQTGRVNELSTDYFNYGNQEVENMLMIN